METLCIRAIRDIRGCLFCHSLAKEQKILSRREKMKRLEIRGRKMTHGREMAKRSWAKKCAADDRRCVAMILMGVVSASAGPALPCGRS
jgi:hypothetical protein